MAWDWTSQGDANSFIKRPMNSFMIWSKTERGRLAQQHPTLKNSDISHLLGDKWAKMPVQDKQPYVEQAKNIKEHHRRTFPAYRFVLFFHHTMT